MERPETEKHGGAKDEKVCLITGATSGIGKATAMGLANMGANVVMVGRDRGRGEAALAEIKEKSANPSVDLMLADLSSQQEIRRLAEEFKEAYPRLDVLINNAGLFRSERITTADGLEMTFAVNHLERSGDLHIFGVLPRGRGLERQVLRQESRGPLIRCVLR
jgi:NAD(P)-dependent dehydrogenase (short-subunit alcohol dehydrogenase family)